MPPDAAAESAVEGSEDVQARRQADEASRYPGQDEWQSDVRAGRERAGTAGRGRRASAGLWRQVEEFQCRERDVPGGEGVCEIARGVGVVGDGFWRAKRARSAGDCLG